MSSRNFRRRHNRRMQRKDDQAPGAPNDPRAGAEPQPQPQGGAGEPPGGPRPAGTGRTGSSPQGRQRRTLNGRRERERQRERPGGEGQPERQRSQRQLPERQREPASPRVSPECPVCHKPVRELPSALTHRLTGQPAHFECIMKEIRDAHALAPQEKLCYLGGGCFGVLQFRQAAGTSRFTIQKRIQYEEKDGPQDWKKTLLVTC